MFWSEKYRSDFAQARREGLAEGEAQGAQRAIEQVARLSRRLESEGRGDEPAAALQDPDRLAQLLRELDA